MSKDPPQSPDGNEEERAERAQDLRKRIKLSISGKRPPASPREATDRAAMEEFAKAKEKERERDPSADD